MFYMKPRTCVSEELVYETRHIRTVLDDRRIDWECVELVIDNWPHRTVVANGFQSWYGAYRWRLEWKRCLDARSRPSTTNYWM